MKDFPVEAISARHDIVEQLIIFGNSNDKQLKAALVPTYKVLLKKFNQKMADLKNERLRNVGISKNSKIALQQTDKIYISQCYPSLDASAYTKEHHDCMLSQRPTKFYSFISLVDFTLKNLINMCTENQLIADFAELYTEYAIPLLYNLKSFGAGVVKRMIIVLLKTFGKLLLNSPLDNLTTEEVKLITPIFGVAHGLLTVFDSTEWTKTDLFMLDEYLSQANKGVYIYAYSTEQIVELMTIFEVAGRAETTFYKHMNKIIGSIDNLRKFELYTSRPRKQTTLSDERNSI